MQRKTGQNSQANKYIFYPKPQLSKFTEISLPWLLLLESMFLLACPQTPACQASAATLLRTALPAWQHLFLPFLNSKPNIISSESQQHQFPNASPGLSSLTSLPFCDYHERVPPNLFTKAICQQILSQVSLSKTQILLDCQNCHPGSQHRASQLRQCSPSAWTNVICHHWYPFKMLLWNSFSEPIIYLCHSYLCLHPLDKLSLPHQL